VILFLFLLPVIKIGGEYLYVKWLASNAVEFAVEGYKKKAERDKRGRRVDSEIQVVPFTGRDLYIPANYFGVWTLARTMADKRSIREGRLTGLLLKVLWPNLEAYTLNNKSEFYLRYSDGGGRTLSISIDTLAYVKNEDTLKAKTSGMYLNRIMNRLLLKDYQTSALQNRYGLKVKGNRFAINPQTGKLIKDEKKNQKVYFQDKWVKIKNKGDRYYQKDDVLYYDREGKVRSLIECMPDPIPKGKVAHCDHIFIMDDLDAKLKIHYHRDFLPEWQTIENKVKELIRSFYKQPINKNEAKQDG